MEITLTADQRKLQLAELQAAGEEGRAVDPEAWGVSRDIPSSADDQPEEDDIFTAHDLNRELLGRGREYPIPGTKKKLYIYGVSLDDQGLMLNWSLTPDHAEPDPADPTRALKAQAQYIRDLKLSQVILCTRKGPTKRSGRCFQLKDRPALGDLLGSSVVEEIVRISNELSGNDETLGGGTRRFFGLIRAYLQTLPSPSSTSDNSPDGSLHTRTRLLSLVTRATSQGRLTAGLLNELAEVETML